MADSLEKIVSIIFQGEDKLSSTLNTMSKRLDGFSGDIQNVTGPLSNLADNVLLLEAALVGLAAGGLALAVNEAGNFSDSFNEISTLIDDLPADKLAEFKDGILEYAQTADISLEDINSAVYTAISAGTEYVESLDLLTVSEKLAVAGRADLEATTKLLAGTLNAYGESAQQAEHYSDVFFGTVKLGQTTLPELAASLSKVTGLASNAGIPIETLAASIAALTATNVPTSEAMTSIKAAISNIIKPSGEAAAMADSLGIQFNATALKTKGFETVLSDVWTATGGNTEQMAKLFGSTEALNAVMVLASDSTGKFENALESLKNATGLMTGAYEKMADNFTGINTSLANNAKVALIKIGNDLLDEYGSLGDGINAILQAIGTGLDAGQFDPILNEIAAFGSRAADLFKNIADNLPEAFEDLKFSGLIDSFDGLGGAVENALEAVFGEIDLETPEGLTKILQKIVDGFTGLTNVTSGVIKGMGPLFDLMGTGVNKFTEMDAKGQELAGSFLGAAKSIDTLLQGFDFLKATLGTIAAGSLVNTVSGLKSLAGVAGSAASTVTGLSSVVAKAAGSAGLVAMSGAAGYAAGTLINKYVPGVSSATEWVAELTDKIFNWTGTQGKVNNDLEEARLMLDAMKASAEKVPETIATQVIFSGDDAGINEVKKLFEEMPKDFYVTLGADFDNLSFEEAYNKLHDVAPDEKETKIQPKVDDVAAKAAADELTQLLTQKEILEFQTKIDIANIEAGVDMAKIMGETAQTSMEWTAKLDIAEAEANAKIMTSAFESINNTMNSTGDVLSSVFGMLGQDLDMQGTWAVLDQIKSENELRSKTFELQEKLTESQIRYNDARTEAIASGDMNITVSGEGLQPHMEAFMWEILSMIKLRANAESAEFLLGI